jgi:hypothetical protein
MRHTGRQVIPDPRDLPVRGAQLDLLTVLIYSLHRSDDFIALIPVLTSLSVSINISARVVAGQRIGATNQRNTLTAG